MCCYTKPRGHEITWRFLRLVAVWIRKQWWDRRWHHMTLWMQGGQMQGVSVTWWVGFSQDLITLSFSSSCLGNSLSLCSSSWPDLELTLLTRLGLNSHRSLCLDSRELALKKCDSMCDLFWLFWAGICTCNPCWPESHCVDRWGTQSDPFALGARMMGHRTFVLKNVLE